jgi:hypothetical protein
MSKLHVEAEQTARAAPDVLWALVSDANQYPKWGPWSAAGYRRPGDTSPRGPGAVSTLSGRIVLRGLRTFYPQMMADLVAAAERHGAGAQ